MDESETKGWGEMMVACLYWKVPEDGGRREALVCLTDCGDVVTFYSAGASAPGKWFDIFSRTLADEKEEDPDCRLVEADTGTFLAITQHARGAKIQFGTLDIGGPPTEDEIGLDDDVPPEVAAFGGAD